jgi:predicted nucleic acid-binding protein
MDDKQRSNAENVKSAAQQVIEEVLSQLKRSDFFSTSLVITVQNGIVRTAKVGTEVCTNFVQPSR